MGMKQAKKPRSSLYSPEVMRFGSFFRLWRLRYDFLKAEITPNQLISSAMALLHINGLPVFYTFQSAVDKMQ